METVVFVEVLDKFGNVRRRERVFELPATVGRGYRCQVIVEDPYVDAEHIRVTRGDDGALRIEDLDSLNGVFLHESKKQVCMTELEPDERIQIGQTIIRFREPTNDVAEARVAARTSFYRDKYFNTWWFAVICLIVSYLASVGPDILSDYNLITQAKVIDRILRGVFTNALVIFVWCGVWTLVSFVVLKRSYFWTHLVIASIAIISMSLGYPLLLAAVFAVAKPEWYAWLSPSYGALVGATMLYCHMLFSTGAEARKLLVFACVFTLVVSGLTFFQKQSAKSRFTNKPRFAAFMMPPALRIVKPGPLEEFLTEAKTLESELKELLEKDKKEKVAPRRKKKTEPI